MLLKNQARFKKLQLRTRLKSKIIKITSELGEAEKSTSQNKEADKSITEKKESLKLSTDQLQLRFLICLKMKQLKKC